MICQYLPPRIVTYATHPGNRNVPAERNALGGCPIVSLTSN
jgi:hypothetical protein